MMRRSKSRKESKSPDLAAKIVVQQETADDHEPEENPGLIKVAAQRLPSVSICTLTRNRQAFLPLLQACVAGQSYPHPLIEWVIVDDSDNGELPFTPDPDLDIRVKHIQLTETLILGNKRNVSHQHCEGGIIVYMDDDDYYPPQRISHAVERLQATGRLVAGATMLPIYFTNTGQAWVAGPYGENHATANTFAFRRELLKQTRYDDTATHAEEKAFLKAYQIPMAQLDPAQTILCMGHSSNTFDKRKLIHGGHNPRMRKLADMQDAFVSDAALTAYQQLHAARSPRPTQVRDEKPTTTKAKARIGAEDKVAVGAWYINRDADRKRRIYIERQQDYFPSDVLLERVKAYTPETVIRMSAYAHIAHLNPLRQAQHCIILSHLRALEGFVRHSEASHALVMEDDIDLSSMQFWDFDLNDLAKAMPEGCGILQLSVIWSATINGNKAQFLVPLQMQCHPRNAREYSTGAYLITRETATKILDFFKPKPQSYYDLLRYKNTDMIIADHLLYDASGLGHDKQTLCLPLFRLGDEELGLLIKRNGHDLMHQASRIHMNEYFRQESPIQLQTILQPARSPITP